MFRPRRPGVGPAKSKNARHQRSGPPTGRPELITKHKLGTDALNRNVRSLVLVSSFAVPLELFNFVTSALGISRYSHLLMTY